MKMVGFIRENGIFDKISGFFAIYRKGYYNKQKEQSPQDWRRTAMEEGNAKSLVRRLPIKNRITLMVILISVGPNSHYQRFFLCQGLYFGPADGASLCGADADFVGTVPYKLGGSFEAVGRRAGKTSGRGAENRTYRAIPAGGTALFDRGDGAVYRWNGVQPRRGRDTGGYGIWWMGDNTK